MSAIHSALILSPRWKADPEQLTFGELLRSTGISVEILSSFDELREKLGQPEKNNACILLDAGASAERESSRAIDAIVGLISRVKINYPFASLLVLSATPPAPLVTAAFRAGADDVIDIKAGEEVALLSALERAGSNAQARANRRARMFEMRKLVDEFLRVLVKAERRTLELEANRAGDDMGEEKESPPRLLLVDDDSNVVDLLNEWFSGAGMKTLIAYSGEEAMDLCERAEKTRSHVDLALVDKQLPGVDGLETIRELRKRCPALPCMMMTGYSSSESAVRAADVGVVGYLLKPFDDMRELTRRVKEIAERYAAERRERRMLARIKQKHAQFLERYLKITTDLEKLGE
ncbi:MAG: response regulator [Deltaproteobacteria bacterium]|nr:response regulator [Deltaproteobacteria bacterium]